MRSFVKIKPSKNRKITLSFIDIGKSCLGREFFTSLTCLLMLFAKIKFSRKLPNLQYHINWGHWQSSMSVKNYSVLINTFCPILCHKNKILKCSIFTFCSVYVELLSYEKHRHQ